MLTVYTTGQAARLCKIAPRTIAERFDSGKLPGYRVPGRRTRRIPRKNLLKFLTDEGTPPDDIFYNHANILLFLSHNTQLVEVAQKALRDVPCRLHHMTDWYEIGGFIQVALAEFCLAVVDMQSPVQYAARITQKLVEKQWEVVLLAEREQPVIKGIAETLRFPFDPELLGARLRSIIA